MHLFYSNLQRPRHLSAIQVLLSVIHCFNYFSIAAVMFVTCQFLLTLSCSDIKLNSCKAIFQIWNYFPCLSQITEPFIFIFTHPSAQRVTQIIVTVGGSCCGCMLYPQPMYDTNLNTEIHINLVSEALTDLSCSDK